MHPLHLPRRSTLVFSATVAAMLVLSVPALAADTRVTIKDFAFSPATVTVTRGTKVIFKNEDNTVHSVVADDKSFHSPALDTGDEFTMTFDKIGAFPYHCGVHPTMQGRVVVK